MAADIPKLIRLLEAHDIKVSDDANTALKIQIGLGNGIKPLVQHYALHGSTRALDVLCNVKDPHEKCLLDLVKEMLHNPTTTPAALILLGQIVQTAPSWVSRIALHPIFNTVLKFINRSHTNVEAEDISALLFLSSLLPHCSGLKDHTLKQMFDTFLNACEFLRLKLRDIRTNPDEVDKINITHLQYAVREYFHAIYGIYPYYLLQHLRGYFEHGRHSKLLDAVIGPLVSGVKLHPNLLFMSKEGELSKDRWDKREAHDFLYDCKRMVIGLIPYPSDGEVDMLSNHELGVRDPSQIFQFLFPPSGNSDSQHSEAGSSMDMGPNVIDLINTPPGTRSSSPHNRTLEQGTKDFVLSEETRRRSLTGSSAASSMNDRRRSRSFLSWFGNKKATDVKDKKEHIYQPLIEVEQVDEAEDAGLIDVPSDGSSSCQTTITQNTVTKLFSLIKGVKDMKDTQTAKQDPSPTTSVNPEKLVPEKCTTPTPAANPTLSSNRKNVYQNGRMTVTPVVTHFDSRVLERESRLGDRPSSRSDSLNTYVSRVSGIEDARDKARDAVRHRSATVDNIVEGNCTPRNRSTTILGLGHHSDSRSSFKSRSSNGTETPSEYGDDSADHHHHHHHARSRFSVSSFFKKFNRQKLNSECMDEESYETSCKHHPVFTIEPSASMERPGLTRTSSAPVLFNENEKTSADQVLRCAHMPTNILGKRSLISMFPYLALIKGPTHTFYSKLEVELENDHDEKAAQYMSASKEFHKVLAELNLSDRLPGRIYDDIGNITKDLPLEKQRDVLRARLQLVNQHLLYERSSRLLHANRNRRLFGRIKQQNTYESEVANLKETVHEMKREREDIIGALTNMRRRAITSKQEFQFMQNDYTNKLSEQEKRIAELECELQKEINMKEHIRKSLMAQLEPLQKLCQESMNAKSMRQLAEEKLEIAEAHLESLHEVICENSNLKDQIEMMERQKEAPADTDSYRNAIKFLRFALSEQKEKFVKLQTEVEGLRAHCSTVDEEIEAERKNSSHLRQMVSRAYEMVKEQASAADQKFLSMQAISKTQEEYIFQLKLQIEVSESKVAKLVKEKEIRERRMSERIDENEIRENPLSERDDVSIGSAGSLAVDVPGITNEIRGKESYTSSSDSYFRMMMRPESSTKSNSYGSYRNTRKMSTFSTKSSFAARAADRDVDCYFFK